MFLLLAYVWLQATATLVTAQTTTLCINLGITGLLFSGDGVCQDRTVGTVTKRGVRGGPLNSLFCEVDCDLGASYTVYNIHSCTCLQTKVNGAAYSLSLSVVAWTTLSTNPQCGICKANSGGGNGDPHMSPFFGDQFFFDGYDKAVFAILSEKEHQLNARFDNAGAGTYSMIWMTAFGFRYRGFSMIVELDPTGYDLWSYVDQEARNASKRRTQAFATSRNSSVAAAALWRPVAEMPKVESVVDNRKLLRVTMNGAMYTAKVGSGAVFWPDHDAGIPPTGEEEAGQVLVYFAESGAYNPGDRDDGPVLVVRTPLLAITFYLESEGALHLDVKMELMGQPEDVDMHGVIGQTITWQRTHTAPGNDTAAVNTVEGSSDADYEVHDGLLGSNFTFTRFNATLIPTTSTPIPNTNPSAITTAERSSAHHAAPQVKLAPWLSDGRLSANTGHAVSLAHLKRGQTEGPHGPIASSGNLSTALDPVPRDPLPDQTESEAQGVPAAHFAHAALSAHASLADNEGKGHKKGPANGSRGRRTLVAAVGGAVHSSGTASEDAAAMHAWIPGPVQLLLGL